MNSQYCSSTDSTCPHKNISGSHSHHHHHHSEDHDTPHDGEGDDQLRNNYKNFGDHPVEIQEENISNIDLPPLSWHGYSNEPKVLTVTNTGRTVKINGQWAGGRPYISGGSLNGTYIFSQIHFHCPSEHEINGVRYPLEMHVVHYKTSYLTQERAMHEKDGTIVLVYLFRLADSPSTVMSHVTKFAHCLKKVNSRREISQITLAEMVTPFLSNYYVYWGSVSTERTSYLLQWIINCNHLHVTRQEIDDLLYIMNSNGSLNGGNLERMTPENGDIFYVGGKTLYLSASRTKAVQTASVSNMQDVGTSEQDLQCTCPPKPFSVDKSSGTSTTSCDVKETSTSPDTTNKTEKEMADEDVSINQTPSKTATSKEKNKKHKKTKSNESSKSSHKDVRTSESTEKVKSKKEAKASEKEAKQKSSLKDDKKKKGKEKKKDDNSSTKPARSTEKVPSKTKTSAKSEKVSFKESKTDNQENKAEKIEEPNKKMGTDDDVEVNFLFAPNRTKSYSTELKIENSDMSKTEQTVDKEELDCPKALEEIILNTATTSEIKLPTDETECKAKELYIYMEHSIGSDKKNVNSSPNTFKEYLVTIVYDHNVLQEYNGMICPNKLMLGHYEGMNLTAKYKEPDNFKVQLKDCFVKLESVEQLTLRTRFLVKENDATNLESDVSNTPQDNPDQSKIEAVKTETHNAVSFRNEPKHNSSSTQEKPYEDVKLSQIILTQSFNENKVEANDNFNDDKALLEKLDDADNGKEKGEITSDGSEGLMNVQAGKVGCNSAPNVDTDVNHSPSSDCKKIAYFKYDKIQKDVSTGKKVFVGTFLTKDEFGALQKRNKISQNFENSTSFDNLNLEINGETLTKSDTVKISETVTKLQGEGEKTTQIEQYKDTLSSYKKTQESYKKDGMTVHRYKTNLPTLVDKTDKKNLLIGKVVTQLQKGSSQLSYLTGILGVDEANNSKVSICSLQETSLNLLPENSSTDHKTSGIVHEISSQNIDNATDSLSHIEISEVKKDEEVTEARKKSKTSNDKDSQSAIIIIPVEVESLSKLELIVVEHTEGIQEKEDKYIPCLNFYKRSIFQPMVALTETTSTLAITPPQ